MVTQKRIKLLRMQIHQYRPTPIKTVEMLECNGHAHKRTGRRLMDLNNANKGKVFDEDDKLYKGIGGVKEAYFSSFRKNNI